MIVLTGATLIRAQEDFESFARQGPSAVRYSPAVDIPSSLPAGQMPEVPWAAGLPLVAIAGAYVFRRKAL